MSNFLSQLPGQMWPSAQLPTPLPGQNTGMLTSFFNPGANTAPPPSFISPKTGGNLAGVAAAALTWWGLSNLKMPVAAGAPAKPLDTKIKLIASVVVGFIVKKGVQARIEHNEKAKQAGFLFNQQFGGIQLPQSQYTLPPGLPGMSGTISTAAFDPDRKAGELIEAYNPNGWNTDENALLSIILTVPPEMFSLVANSYLQLYGRNLLNDLNEQLDSWLHQAAWEDYRKQIK